MKKNIGIEISVCLVVTSLCSSLPALAATVAASSQIVQHGVDYSTVLKKQKDNVYIKEHGINYLCGHISLNENMNH
ncbi:MAG TPA: hypothetical protein V6C81_04325 [Planktothrix sp.]|jgi:hypothetical protein